MACIFSDGDALPGNCCRGLSSTVLVFLWGFAPSCYCFRFHLCKAITIVLGNNAWILNCAGLPAVVHSDKRQSHIVDQYQFRHKSSEQLIVPIRKKNTLELQQRCYPAGTHEKDVFISKVLLFLYNFCLGATRTRNIHLF